MKELSIEEKAKRYDEAIQRARNIVNSINVGLIGKDSFEAVFPELKESEGERIRKGIIRNLEYLMDRAEGFVKDELKERIAWLEKQGSQNLANSEKTCKDEQKPAWSEEDERKFSDILALLWGGVNRHYNAPDLSTWFKSLKDRVQPQPKQGEQNLVLRDTFGYEDGRLFGMNEGIGLVLDNPEKYGLQKPVKWSKEDEKYTKDLVGYFTEGLSLKHTEEDIANWLKSLRPQTQWKPSKRQKEALLWCVVHLGGADKQVLGELLEELNKL